MWLLDKIVVLLINASSEQRSMPPSREGRFASEARKVQKAGRFAPPVTSAAKGAEGRGEAALPKTKKKFLFIYLFFVLLKNLFNERVVVNFRRKKI